jgi:hypothetical protein
MPDEPRPRVAVIGGFYDLDANPNVWSAALLQAKNEMVTDRSAQMYTALVGVEALRARMECAAPRSHLVGQSWKTPSGFGFEERRVRPLCHRRIRQQTGEVIIDIGRVR